MASNDAAESSKISEMERDLAQQAFVLFEKQQFTECRASLDKLAKIRSSDHKLMMNQALVDYQLSSFQKTEAFEKTLIEVGKKAHMDVLSIASLEDVDQCAIYYNFAVLLYYQQQYYKSLQYMSQVYQFTEAMDENFGRKVLFFMVELYLSTYQPDKGLAILSQGEKLFERENKEGGSTEAQLERYKAQVNMYRVRCYAMLRSFRLCKKEVKSMDNPSGMPAVTLAYVKSFMETQRGNGRKALKMLGAATLPSQAGLTTMYWNNVAIVHLYMKKHHLAAHYLHRAAISNRSALQNMLASCPGYQSVSGENKKAMELNSYHSAVKCRCPLPQLATNRCQMLYYNLSIELLHCGCPMPAFDYLMLVVDQFPTNPRLWLRLAECCIMAHTKANEDDEERFDVVRGAVGSGVHRKLILQSSSSKLRSSSESTVMPALTLEFASICLRNARTILDNSVQSKTEVTLEGAQLKSRTGSDYTLFQAPPSNPMHEAEVGNLRCAVLAASSYVALSLHDYLMAQRHAQSLLTQPRLSPALKYVGQMYLAEALIVQDQIADGIQQLSTESITSVSTSFPQPSTDKEKIGDGENATSEVSTSESFYPWSPSTVTHAQAIMQYNLAVAFAIRGEHDKALLHVNQCQANMDSPPPPQVHSLLLYLELIEGRRTTLHSLLKNQFGHLQINRLQ